MRHVAMSDAHCSWHVRQLHKLRKWKTPRADLRERAYPVRNRMRGRHQIIRLVRGARDNRAVFSCGDRISSPLVCIPKLAYRLRRSVRRKRLSR